MTYRKKKINVNIEMTKEKKEFVYTVCAVIEENLFQSTIL